MSCITLLSDFGTQDAHAARTKGILMQYITTLPILDISHQIEPYHLQQAAYILASSYKHFPKGAFHVLLFDIFSNQNRTLLLCEKEGHYFLAPDNGIMSMTFSSLDGVWRCYNADGLPELNTWIHEAGKIIKKLQGKSPQQLKLQPAELRHAPINWRPTIDGSVIECHVIHIDRFENVIVNITQEQFEKTGRNRPFRIRFMRSEEVREISNHYTDVREGEKLCRFNSAGFLEISINRGRAASLFGLRVHREHQLLYNTVKIFFE